VREFNILAKYIGLVVIFNKKQVEIFQPVFI